MKIILTKRDLKKPLKINGVKATEEDKKRLLQDFIKNNDIIKEIIFTKNAVTINTDN